MKIICIDYDGTYTHFPELLECIVNKSKSLGYKVILTTMRYENEIDIGIKEISLIVDQVIFTSRKAKLPFLLNMGIKPDIWVDDNPYWILNNS